MISPRTIKFGSKYSPVREKIFDALCEHPYGLTMRELIDFAYDNADGGPDDAIAAITVAIVGLNKFFKRHKEMFRIRSKRHGGRSGSGYQLWIVR